MPNSLTCLACGAPVEPAPNKTVMPCPFCGSALTIPAELRWSQPETPESLPSEPGARPAFDPFRAAEQARFSGEKAEKARAEAQFVSDALRKAQPLAAGAVSAYALWASAKRFVPGCLIALGILCALACGTSIVLLVLMTRGN
jgi:hypothetical protein